MEEERDTPDTASKAGGGGGRYHIAGIAEDLRRDLAHKLKLAPLSFSGYQSGRHVYSLSGNGGRIGTLSGVGEGKARKFGKPFVELISKYVEENEIIRPQDMVVKLRYQ